MKRLMIITLIGTAGMFASSLTMAEGQYVVANKSNNCKVWNAINNFRVDNLSYTGACAGGYANGQGILTWSFRGKSGGKYAGTFKQGKFDRGTVHYVDGIVQTGIFKNNTYQGNPAESVAGQYVVANKSKNCKVWNTINNFKVDNLSYTGACIGGYANGQGTLTWSFKGQAGGKYVGTFKQGKFDRGTVRYVEGWSQAGVFENNTFKRAN